MIKKIKKLKTPTACLLFLLLAMPAFGEEWPPKIKINNFNELIPYRETGVPFLTDKIVRFVNLTRTANGFVLYELLKVEGTRLNICYLKKNLKNAPILDFNRLFLEVELNF
ncbi:MAG: hypothetical protein R6X10_10105 [Desulfobacterales bacterium]